MNTGNFWKLVLLCDQERKLRLVKASAPDYQICIQETHIFITLFNFSSPFHIIDILKQKSIIIFAKSASKREHNCLSVKKISRGYIQYCRCTDNRFVLFSNPRLCLPHAKFTSSYVSMSSISLISVPLL